MKEKWENFVAVWLIVAILASVLVFPLTANAADGDQITVGSTTATVDSSTVWRYLDDNTDPAGDSTAAGYDATSWTHADFDDSAWKTGTGSFGAKNGKIADLGGGCTPNTLLNQYISGTTDIPAFFFRTTFQVEDATKVTSLVGSVLYDDGAKVYLNGTEIANFEIDDTSHTNNLFYDGSNAGAPKTGEINLLDGKTLGLLKSGTNVLAVELHQGRPSSSDIYLDVTLTASTEKIVWEPDGLVVNIGSTERSVSFTWLDTSANAGTLHFNGKDYAAHVTAAQKTGYYSNRVTVYGLTASQTYAFTITGGNGAISSEHTIATQAFGSGESFSFVALGDPQIGASGNAASDTSGWTNTLSKIASDGTPYAFLFSLGDQVDTRNNEDQYTGFLSPLTGGAAVPILANLAGNHDNNAANYQDHYTLPNGSYYGTTTGCGGDFYFTYNGALFMVLNSNNLSIAEHKAFLENTVAAFPDATWKTVAFHKSIYSVASHVTESDIVTLRNGLSKVFYDLDIDVVLQGHDHVYARSLIMQGENGQTAVDTGSEVQKDICNPDGVQYVTMNSASGSKFYKITQEAFRYTAVQNQERVPNYSAITITKDSYTVKTLRVTDGSVVDEFTIHKPEFVEAEAPTCGTDGHKAYYKCAICGKIYDENGKEVTEADVTIPATGEHVWDEGTVTTEPTTESEGVKTYTCTICGQTKTEPIDKLTPSEPDNPEPSDNPEPEESGCDGGEGCRLKGVFQDIEVKAANNPWYHQDVEYAYVNGWMHGDGGADGKANGIFRPDDAVTRAEFVQILYNQAGQPETEYQAAYTDVKENDWFAPAVLWATQKEIVVGVGDGKFDPDAKIRREDMALILYRMAGKPTSSASLSEFSDADKVDDYALDAVRWAVESGILRGYDDAGNTLRPRPLTDEEMERYGYASRAETAAMLHRYLK